MSITIDNIKTWRDWGMVLTPAKDKKPLTKKGKWSADWSEDDLLKAERLVVGGMIGLIRNYLMLNVLQCFINQRKEVLQGQIF
mgnify:CR=1 FL=1